MTVLGGGMGYHIDFSKMTLADLRKRLQGVDPIPSQLPLLDGMAAKLAALKKAGISTVEELSLSLKGAKGIDRLAEASGIEEDYLVLLRRAIEGFRPKPQPLAGFPGIDEKAVAALRGAGIRDSAALYAVALARKERAALSRKTGVSLSVIGELARLSDLCRIQWVGATYARLLLNAGYDGPAKIAAADPETIRQAVSKANASLKLSKAEIGLKDSARLIALAGFIAEELEA
jgi:hypothetical protein